MAQKFYRLDKILKADARYNIIFGERSNGKTFAVLEYGVKEYVRKGKQIAILRRWTEDFTGKRGATMFDALVSVGLISKITNGEWNSVWYFSSRWYLCRYDKETGKRECDERPFAFGFSLTSMEHDKSTSYPNITTILYDEFLTRSHYLPGEFMTFCQVVSTIVRGRKDVKIFMLGNAVNKYCPYFQEMGLKHIREMKPGDIDIYKYGEENTPYAFGKDNYLIVAVEYTESTKKGKQSDIYFAFDNPKLRMITRGEWEIDIYPHLPYKYKPKNVLFNFFINFDEQMLHCEIIDVNNSVFIYIHPKTSPIQDEDRDLIFTTECDPRPNWRRNILKPTDNIGRKIYTLFKSDKIFYSDNETGELLRNYLLWCSNN